MQNIAIGSVVKAIVFCPSDETYHTVRGVVINVEGGCIKIEHSRAFLQETATVSFLDPETDFLEKIGVDHLTLHDLAHLELHDLIPA